jgi:plastocyanin
MRRRRLLAATGVAGAAALAGCAAIGSAGGETEYDVGMTAVAYDPPTITVETGDEVVWYNGSSRGHTVTAYADALPEGATFFASGGFESEPAARREWNAGLAGNVASGESYSHVFETPGTHGYFCIPHERAGMVGTVEVE